MAHLFQAQSHIYNHIFSFINSMSLKCAIQLEIPDIVHNHKAPITLPKLVSALQIPPSKTHCVQRLMKLLINSGFFSTKKIEENGEEIEGYILTPSSQLLLKTSEISLAPMVLGMLDHGLVNPWNFLGDWFRGNDLTPFETAHGMNFFEYGKRNSEFMKIMNEIMASESRIMKLIVDDHKDVFCGFCSLVDVGGGTGTLCRIISEALPGLKCTVFDLPAVVAGLPESDNLKFVGGDMFLNVPNGDVIVIKSVLHNWNDEDCVKILTKCKEAIENKEKGKIIIIDIVINEKEEEDEKIIQKLYIDMLMMSITTGRERNETEWSKIFSEAGFSHYKITPTFDLKSIIKVYP